MSLAEFMRLLTTFLLVFSLHANAGEILSEQSQSLGFGFRLVHRSEAVQASFESVGHFTYFFYRERKLSQTDTYSISPSGRYAVFQDGPTGKIVLFNASADAQTILVPKFLALVERFKWNETENVVRVEFRQEHEPMEIQLEKAALRLQLE